MRQKIIGLTNAIRQVLESHSGAVRCKQICYEIKDKGLVDISPEQEEITWGQPNFHHSVRKILSVLSERGEIIHLSRGIYKINHD